MSDPKGPPFEVKFSEKVVAKYGFKDAHVELEVELPKIPLVKTKHFKQRFEADEVRRLKEAVDAAVLWNSLPDYQRERDGA